MASNLFDFARHFAPWMTLWLGMLMGGLRSAWSFVYEHTIGYVVTKMSISVTVEDTEHRDAYTWLSKWVENSLRKRKVNSLLLRSCQATDRAGLSETRGFEVIPEYGTYYLLHAKRLMTVEHRKEEPHRERTWQANHSIRLRVWLSRDREVILAILNSARDAYEKGKAKLVDYYRWDSYSDWIGSTIPGRAASSLFHAPGLIEDLFGDVGTFLSSKQMYEDLGVPYRRGYLLSGPPGTGKSSLILAVAWQFGLPVYSVPLRGDDLSGERLTALLANCRRPALLALEDIDCLKVATSRHSQASDKLTIADVLNAIDGIGASEDRLLFLTANRPETLDFALTRAGRVDRRFVIDYARDQELKRFYDRVGRYVSTQPWPEFRAALPERATIADAQALAFREESTAGLFM